MKNSLIKMVSIALPLAISCNNNSVATDRSNGQPPFTHMTGCWIPKEIAWGGDNVNSKDTGDIFRIANFPTLCFDTTGSFFLFSSTQRHPKNYGDSIIFAGEPVVKFYKGVWKCHDTTLNLKYKKVDHGSAVSDGLFESEIGTFIFLNSDTLIRFRNRLFIKTSLYDKLSRRTIDSYINSN